MGYRHDRATILAAAAALVTTDGLTGLTYGRLAKSLGIADRTIVYYFPTKTDLTTEVLGTFALRLQSLLDSSLGPEPRAVEELLARSWPILTTRQADEVMAVYFEAVGLAAAGIAPYDSIVPAIVGAWVDWLSARVAAGSAADRRATALGLLAQLDGLLLLRTLAGAGDADIAARALGLRFDRPTPDR